MIFPVSADGWMALPAGAVRCAIGRGGVCAASEKREGDGRTPAGLWPVRRVLWRPDRGRQPASQLSTAAINPHDGWCDAPNDESYNRAVTLPYATSAEHLWRDDHLYDRVVVLGHNDDPVVSGAGSAIFLHLARPDFSPTEGCVALAAAAMEQFLSVCAPGDLLAITLPSGDI